MPEPLAVALLVLAFLVGLLLVPFGLPGLWLMVLALLAFAALGGFEAISWSTLVIVVVLAALAEVAEAWLGFRFAKRYGGTSRAGWGAVAGGFVGAVVGTPIPIIGSVIGAFLGAFLGAVLLERSAGSAGPDSVRAGWGAVLGRAAGAAVKVGVGLVIATVGLFAALG